MSTVRYDQVSVGDTLPELPIDLTVSLIVAGAVASQDFTPVHHDKQAAQAAGMQDVFMNILTTNGLVSRFVTDWAGINARVKNVNIKLGTPNLPGDTMTLRGAVTEKDDADGSVVVEVTGKNAWGNHVTGTVKVALEAGSVEMPTTLKDEAAIVGIGETEYSKNSGRSEVALASEAVRAAIKDAGLSPSDIDGMTTFTMDTSDEIEIARAVGIKDLTFFSRTPHGGGAAIGVVHQAAMAVATGSAKAVVVYRALNGRSGARYSDGVSGGATTSDLIHWSWYMPSGLMTPASWVAMLTQRYMHDSGCTADDLAEVCMAQRRYAVNNPRAFFYERPMTLEDHRNARWIVEPLRLYDCCQETDGGAACVIVSPELARDLPGKHALIRGVAQGAGADQEVMTSYYSRNLNETPEMDVVARKLWEVSGLSADDIDAAVIYDAFSSIVLFQLESFGFCKKLQAKDFIKDGALDLGGRLPINTHGGQLSEAYIHGVNGINEGVRLIRGESHNQPKKNDHVLVTAGVGIPTSAMVLGQMP